MVRFEQLGGDVHGVILITGIMAAGKSTVAQLLAERLPRSVHVRGDRFRRMIVNGRVQNRGRAGGGAVQDRVWRPGRRRL